MGSSSKAALRCPDIHDAKLHREVQDALRTLSVETIVAVDDRKPGTTDFFALGVFAHGYLRLTSL